MVKCGYFNAVDHDRKYDAKSFNEILNGLITDGVLNGISVSKNNRSQVKIYSGIARFDNIWIFNDSDYLLDVDNSELNELVGVYRRDAVTIYTDEDGRSAGFEIVKGIKSFGGVVDPIIPTDGSKKYHVIGYVDNYGQEVYTSSPSTSYNCIVTNLVGTSSCPYATNGGGKCIDLSSFFVQYDILWDEFMDGKSIDLSPYAEELLEFLQSTESTFDSWMDSKATEVETWAAGVVGKLTPEQAAQFQAQLASIETNYLSKSEVTNSIFDLNDPDKVPTSAIVFRVFKNVVPEGGD